MSPCTATTMFGWPVTVRISSPIRDRNSPAAAGTSTGPGSAGREIGGEPARVARTVSRHVQPQLEPFAVVAFLRGSGGHPDAALRCGDRQPQLAEVPLRPPVPAAPGQECAHSRAVLLRARRPPARPAAQRPDRPAGEAEESAPDAWSFRGRRPWPPPPPALSRIRLRWAPSASTVYSAALSSAPSYRVPHSHSVAQSADIPTGPDRRTLRPGIPPPISVTEDGACETGTRLPLRQGGQGGPQAHGGRARPAGCAPHAPCRILA